MRLSKTKVLTVFIIGLFIGAGVIPTIRGEDDYFEDNDTFEDAAEITAGYYANLNCSDPDWYKIGVGEGMTLTVSIYFTHANGDLDLWLYDSGQMEIMHSLTATDNETIIYDVTNADEYYILVDIYGGGYNVYDMEVEVEITGLLPVHNIDTDEYFNTIQAGIDAVNTTDGHTIIVDSGTYYENVIIDKSINLTGENKDNTIIDGGGSGNVVYVSADYVDIMEFAIGGSGSGSYNAGINVISSNNVITYCKIYLNYGDGIRLSSSSGNTISNCDVFSNGIVVYRKGIVLLSQSNNNLITNCDVWDNSEGIDIDHSDDNDVTNCNIYSNVYRGIYIDVCSNDNLVQNCDVLNNGWAIYLYDSDNTINDCSISGNDYGICIYGSYNTINDCSISDNDYGVSIYASYSTVRECNISGNDYGIYSYSSHHDNHIYHNNIVENAIYQAYDSGSNVWDDGFPSGGNYWSDFDEPSEGAYDNNSDGIVDLPYNLYGGSNQDRYPLMNQYFPQPPIADFIYSPMDPTTDDVIQFTDNSSDVDGIIVKWTWDFDDGNTSSQQDPTHSYANDGTYAVNLIVMDDDGDTDSTTQYINVDNYGPNADFSYLPSDPLKDEIIQFTDESYDTSSGTISSWYWEFGDGDTSTLQNPPHSYDYDGTYQVNLTVSNGTGATHSISRNIHVGMISVNISLTVGWNMITIPVNNTWMASTLAENITGCQMVSWFDAEFQILRTHIVGVPAYDFPIQDGFGYFILVDQNSTFSVSGLPLHNVSVQLYEGWNMIGWYNQYNTTASTLAENITNCSMVSWFDAEFQILRTHIVGVPGYDFDIDCGMGLFILVDEASIWNGEG